MGSLHSAPSCRCLQSPRRGLEEFEQHAVVLPQILHEKGFC